MKYTFQQNPFTYPYKHCDIQLSRISQIRYLEVTLDSKLNVPQFNNITKKAYRQSGFLHRMGKPFKSFHTYKILYKQL